MLPKVVELPSAKPYHVAGAAGALGRRMVREFPFGRLKRPTDAASNAQMPVALTQ